MMDFALKSKTSNAKAVAYCALVLMIVGCGSGLRVETDSRNMGESGEIKASFRLGGSSQFKLADDFANRLSNIEFDVYANCGARGDTTAFTFSNYTLEVQESFTLSAACTDAEVHLRNVDVTYENIQGTILAGTLADYASSIVNENSILVMERTVTGMQAEFELVERVIAFEDATSQVAITPMNASARLENNPNSYCSGVTVDTSVPSKITATFDNPEIGSPAGTYVFSASPGTLPVSATEIETAPSVEYDFSDSDYSDLTGGPYTFTMSMVPDTGQPNDDERCDATITFDLETEVMNHVPIFHYSGGANLSNFSGYGTAALPYAFEINSGSSNGEVSFAIDDANGQATALIECTSKPAWVAIDNANDKITFAPGSTGTSVFHCYADDGIDTSVTSIYFSITVL